MSFQSVPSGAGEASEAVPRTKRPRGSYKLMDGASKYLVQTPVAAVANAGASTSLNRGLMVLPSVNPISRTAAPPSNNKQQLPTIVVEGQSIDIDSTNNESGRESMSNSSSPIHQSNPSNPESQELSGNLTNAPASAPTVIPDTSIGTTSTKNGTEHPVVSSHRESKPCDKTEHYREAQRQAQRAFRKRREVYIQTLEARAERYKTLRRQAGEHEKTIKDLEKQVAELLEEKARWMKDREELLRVQENARKHVELWKAECKAERQQNKRLNQILLQLLRNLTDRLLCREDEHNGGRQQQQQQRGRPASANGHELNSLNRSYFLASTSGSTSSPASDVQHISERLGRLGEKEHDGGFQQRQQQRERDTSVGGSEMNQSSFFSWTSTPASDIQHSTSSQTARYIDPSSWPHPHQYHPQ